jgi:ubiquinone/menaquinone biosynthesis C-methylase UbiE
MTLQKDPEGTEIRFLDQAASFAGQRVLEIGCGDGRLTWRYAHSAGHIIGIDPDMEALRVAAAECPVGLHEIVAFDQANALNLPFPHAMFDIAILSWSL